MAAAESSSSVVSAEALTYTLCLSSENRAYSERRTEKLAIFSSFSGRDVFIWLPTGFGKRILFQMLPFLFCSRLRFISKKTKKTMTESCTQCSCDVAVRIIITHT